MNRETKRVIEFGDKPAARAAIRREYAKAKADGVPEGFTISLQTWWRSQPNSTRKGYNRGNIPAPPYIRYEYE